MKLTEIVELIEEVGLDKVRSGDKFESCIAGSSIEIGVIQNNFANTRILQERELHLLLLDCHSVEQKKEWIEEIFKLIYLEITLATNYEARVRRLAESGKIVWINFQEDK